MQKITSLFLNFNEIKPVEIGANYEITTRVSIVSFSLFLNNFFQTIENKYLKKIGDYISL